ncbi:hypothetical protein [Thermoflavimicrobium daqui]|jgi:hypothetical protein|uniref:Uncharacterized protein n=1 Tax=Thermoflavimicrobium daqui TaxID=2137476 RepID=A0A364K6I9_9BACL|nr:hypothetical protein [Thermoflavimicrobium daqui]RAL25897.1 hypothetical protein DL897_07415 [Thermoflavimicrobium daqui]
MKYNIIYADPLWQYRQRKENGVTENHYQTMNLKVWVTGHAQTLKFVYYSSTSISKCISNSSFISCASELLQFIFHMIWRYAPILSYQ